MNTPHTPEPWSINTFSLSLFDNKGERIAWMIHRHRYTEAKGIKFYPEWKANAERIVACVNACAGIALEDLERCADNTKSIFKEMVELKAKIAELEAQLIKTTTP